uniref:Facilitated trehalose transporter Tret1 n=2 Tax=Cacopsylla melanoneura TaxID=428564 RepID=A0A8D8LA96_9HEMI
MDDNDKPILKDVNKSGPLIVPSNGTTNTTPIKPESSSTPEILASVAAASINIQVGLILAYSAILIPELVKEDSELKVSTTEISWIASVISLLAPVGSFLGGFCMEWTGRIKAMEVSMVPYLLGWIIIALSQNVFQLIFGRCLCGLSMSMSANACNVYIAEVSRPKLRGSLMSVGSLFISFGMLLIYLQGFLIKSWRTTAWLCVLYGLIPLFAIIIYSSPSPVWLVTQNRIEEAKKSLKFLLRMDKSSSMLADLKLKELIAEKQLRERHNDTRSYLTKFVDTVRKPQTYKPFWILLVLFFLQQFTGLYIILVFAVPIFKEMGSKQDPYISSIWLGVLRLIMSVLTTYALRSFGRRKLCIFSGFVMTVAMFLSGYFIHTGLHQQDSILKWIPVLCMLVFISAATPGLMTIPWMISAEMFPHEVRGIIQGPVMAWANIIMFAAIKTYPSMSEFFGGVYRVHWFFAIMSFVSIVFVWLFMPETHNRKLIEIEHYFRHNSCYITRNEEAERKFILSSLNQIEDGERREALIINVGGEKGVDEEKEAN